LTERNWEKKKKVKEREKYTNGGNGGDDLSELEFVENGCLTGGVETDHKYTHLLLRKQATEKLGEREPHFQLF